MTRLSGESINTSTCEYVEYDYDRRNRMISATNYSSGGTIVQAVEFTYDVFDRWIAKTVDDDGAGLFLLGLFEGADSWTSGPFEK